MTLDELNAERAIALDRIRNGDRTSLSGAAKSSGKSYSMSARDHLFEVNYAIRLLTGQLPPSVTYFDAACNRG